MNLGIGNGWRPGPLALFDVLSYPLHLATMKHTEIHCQIRHPTVPSQTLDACLFFLPCALSETIWAIYRIQ